MVDDETRNQMVKGRIKKVSGEKGLRELDPG